MGGRKALVVIALLLALITFLQLWGQVLYSLGTKKEEGLSLLELSKRVFPLDFRPYYKKAYYLLRKGSREKDNRAIAESIENFKKALALNPFHVNSHYFLAKAYLLYNFPSSPYFNEALQEFKRAARLGFKRRTIVLDTVKLLLSLWPLLDERDRLFCRQLLSGMARRISWKDMKEILEIWWLYSKDQELIMEALSEKPSFLPAAARQLLALRAPLQLRWEMLARYEDYMAEKAKRILSSIEPLSSSRKVERLKLCRAYLFDRIRGYRTLLQKGTDPYQLQQLRTKVLFQLIQEELKMGTDPYQHIVEFLSCCNSLSELNKLEKLLHRSGYFSGDDLKKLYLENLILFKLKHYSKLIENLERLEQSLLLVRRENLNDYLNLLFLLEDAYIENKLLMVALNLADRIKEIAPHDGRLYYAYYRIFQLTGFDNVDPELKTSVLSLTNPSSITVEFGDRPVFSKQVFLADQPEGLFLEFPQPSLEKTKKHLLLQVFVNGKIAYEEYGSQVSGPVKITRHLRSGKNSISIKLTGEVK